MDRQTSFRKYQTNRSKPPRPMGQEEHRAVGIGGAEPINDQKARFLWRVTDGARTRHLLSRATIRRPLFPGVAHCCKIGLDKPIPLLEVARCSWVLRAQWCQQWCQHPHRANKVTTPCLAAPRGRELHEA